MKIKEPKMIIGWREWLALPDLAVPAIKAKVDTGAKTSALHAFDISPFEEDGMQFVSFNIHPLQGNDDIEIPCKAPLVDRRKVMNSGGQSQKRYVIATTLQIAGRSWPIELTLTNRDEMKFRMLLGRNAMSGRLIVDPHLSMQAGAKHGARIYEKAIREGSIK
ncbi:ATP-dependent zinc protease family protein [Pseudodesulfovibrio sediminis]|uniref:Ribosomal protein S6 modification protein n=1 Tax=Pseudodesulfovibrio sediminis TaxID=2810563 RepID=A0ABM7P293_9BACT|nr:ATP-dependent zinc protease [Pseudodesulfovibrio sediminis]BCS86908.1 ribosomal protein S6 modification protein [Pseudodesulfovibrio sediminis]